MAFGYIPFSISNTNVLSIMNTPTQNLSVDNVGGNTFINAALPGTVTGTGNIVVGKSGPGLTSGNNNVLIGNSVGTSLTTQSGNVVIGPSSTCGAFSNCVVFGNGATATANNTFVLGSSGNNIADIISVGISGAAAPPPSNPQTYLKIRLNGVDLQIPCYLHA